MAEKRLLVAYLCWIFGGLFGLHHFYLGRDKHAFITFATFGGYFGLGLIRDLWRLPEYVKEANGDLDEMLPNFSVARQSGLMVMGNLFAYLASHAIPHELLDDSVVTIIRFLTIPFASALGVWLVGNVGRHQGSIVKPLAAAYLAAIPSLFYEFQFASISTLAAVIGFNKNRECRIKREQPKSFIRRTAVIATWTLIYLALWTSWLYFGCTVEDPETSETIKCRTALSNFLNSPAYTNFSEAVWMLVEHTRHQGIAGLWREIMQEFDVSGRNAALVTLGLKEDASSQEILLQYKKLSREYHPDRQKDEFKKSEMHEKFIQVQEAYSRLQIKRDEL